MLTTQELRSINFGNEAGDDIEPGELKRYFVELPNIKTFTNLNEKIVIATAKKGIGKSALIQWLSIPDHYLDIKPLIVKIRGADISRERLNLKSTLENPQDYIADWMKRIATIINREIAKNINLALSDDSISLVETAELEGFRSRSIISSLLDRLKLVIEKKQITTEKIPIKNELELLKRFNCNYIIFLIDDLDATFQNKEKELLELSTFFSACRYLLQDVKDISFRITMRSDVWPIIRRFDESLDKVEQYVQELKWSESVFKQLLYKRLEYEFNKNKIARKKEYYTSYKDNYYLNQVFEKQMEWGAKLQYTYRVLYTLSYSRPRWGIQLCKLAQKQALSENKTLINRNILTTVWGEYGKKRISDLISEHKHQSKDIEEIINAFRGVERRLSRDELILTIKNKILNHLSTIIDGEKVNSPLQIGHFLYRIGFIVARSNIETDQYHHYYFEEMPDFLSNRTNSDFGMEWEIHPCFRQALDIVKLNESKLAKNKHR
ncbi:hypothetical protein EHR01_10130 [Leptospira mtsangambouensis]|uniref:ATP-binding protein n=1 Tax=Leptospira mtsangambouensis TaxID=2484912 RepID=A0ABY2NZ63_9LEPT|nr:hypothetical protein [Leptospira mtsangambouensis]TGM74764.1 hypothetical protein EHR01_10130 [Leptospira mtsangambouensis]